MSVSYSFVLIPIKLNMPSTLTMLHSLTLFHKLKQTAVLFPFLFSSSLPSCSAPLCLSQHLCWVHARCSDKALRSFCLCHMAHLLAPCPAILGNSQLFAFPTLIHPNNLDEGPGGGDLVNGACIKTSCVISCIHAINLAPSRISIKPYQVGHLVEISLTDLLPKMNICWKIYSPSGHP